MSFRSKTLRRLFSLPERLASALLSRQRDLAFLRETQGTQTPISFRDWFRQEVMGVNRGPYWPVHPASTVTGWRNIVCGVETSPGCMSGCYIQGIGRITIGDYTQIGPNVTMISANHDGHDLRVHEPSEINIGAYCWFGSGAVVLPGVTLGDFTIVGAGTVVTKSVPEGHAVLVGNPARVLRRLDPALCPRHQSPHEYCGFVRKSEFEAFRAKELTH
jgi:serine acetyltransferase